VLAPAEFPGGKGLGMNGSHRPDGLFVLWGRGVSPGVTVEASVRDVAPTLLALMGEAIPAHMDGRVVGAALTGHSGALAGHGVARSGSEATRNRRSATTPQEAEAIRQRLERLGYL